MYQTKDNFKGFPMAIMLAQSYSHSCLSRTQEGWLPHMDFPNPPLGIDMTDFVLIDVCIDMTDFVLIDVCIDLT